MEDKSYVDVRGGEKDEEYAIVFNFRTRMRPSGLGDAVANTVFDLPLGPDRTKILEEATDDQVGFRLAREIFSSVTGVQRVVVHQYNVRVTYGRAFNRHELVLEILRLYQEISGVEKLNAFYPPKLQPVRIEV